MYFDLPAQLFDQHIHHKALVPRAISVFMFIKHTEKELERQQISSQKGHQTYTVVHHLLSISHAWQ